MALENGLAKYPSLKGKAVFITGGGSGIGEGIVSAFAVQGARVAFIDIAIEASLALCEHLAGEGHEKPLFRQCDIRDIPALQAVMRELAAEVLDIASAGLRERGQLNAAGDSESGFLDPLRDVVASGKTFADVMLDRYHGEWNGDVSRVYEDYSF